MRQIYLAPNKGAVIGNAVTQGVNQAIQNVMNMRYRQQSMNLQRMRYQAQLEQAKAMADYRKAIGEAALRKTGDVPITPEFLHAAAQLGVRPEALGQFMMGQMAPSAPASAPMTTESYLNQKVNGAPPNLSGPPGGTSGLPSEVKGPAGAGPTPAQPSAPAAGGQVPVTLSYPQRQLLEKTLSAQALAQRGIPGAMASMYGADQRLMGLREGNMTKEQIQQMVNDAKREHDAFMAEANQKLQGLKNTGAVNTARARVGTKAAGASVADKAGLANLNSLNKQIQDAQKTIANPTHGIEGVVLTDEQKAQRSQGAQQQLNGLIQQRDALYKQYPQLRGAGAPTQPPMAAPGTAAPAGPAVSPGAGPLRIYTPKEASQAPAGALIQLPNGNVHKVIEAHPGGDPMISKDPIQMAPARAPQSVPVALPGQPVLPPPPAPEQPAWGQ